MSYFPTTNLQGTISTTNSSTTPLSANTTFTGSTFEDMTNISSITTIIRTVIRTVIRSIIRTVRMKNINLQQYSIAL